MTTTLQSELAELAERFVSSVLQAMRAASLGDLAQETGRAVGARSVGAAVAVPRGRPAAGAKAGPQPARPRAGGRRRRATPGEVQHQKDVALAAARQLKAGFGKGDVMKKSGSSVDLGRALALLVAEGKLSKKGDRRLTRYFVKA